MLIRFGMYITQRGKCVRRRVVISVVIPNILKDFVHVDENKTELYSLMSHHVTLLQRAVYESNGHNMPCSLTQIGIMLSRRDT